MHKRLQPLCGFGFGGGDMLASVDEVDENVAVMTVRTANADSNSVTLFVTQTNLTLFVMTMVSTATNKMTAFNGEMRMVE